MSGPGIYINGHVWRDVTHETTTDFPLSWQQVLEIDGDPRRRHEIKYTDSSDG